MYFERYRLISYYSKVTVTLQVYQVDLKYNILQITRIYFHNNVQISLMFLIGRMCVCVCVYSVYFKPSIFGRGGGLSYIYKRYKKLKLPIP